MADEDMSGNYSVPKDDDNAHDGDYEKSVDAIARYGPGNVTSHAGTRLCIDIKTASERKRFFDTFAKSGQDVYIIAVTNNVGKFNKITRMAYARLVAENKEAVLGRWTDPETRDTYCDTSFVISGISKEQALL